ncbi:MAG TPA: hypothetical protein VFE31_00805 [Opitutaceae bacterium]|jgi:hypothetical protein|nr:hypothetical protein [Opitutaceae bacterium]
MKKVALGIAPLLVIAGLSSSLGRASENVWSDDAVPPGAVELAGVGESWHWVSRNPQAYSGAVAHQSALAAGLHEHFFNYAAQPLAIGAADNLFAYVYLDPAHPPAEVMLSWNDGSWDHRAYWGADRIGYGVPNSSGRRYLGPLPPTGQWVRLEVPASVVGLAGRSVTGMAFSTFDGRVTYDKCGDDTPDTIMPAVYTPAGGTDWCDDRVPSGAAELDGADEGWKWISANPAPYTGRLAHQSALALGLHEHFFNYATQTITPRYTDVLYTYVYLDPKNPPSEIMLSWNADNWEHRAYWGGDRIGYGTDHTDSRQYMGPLPAAGQWVRLEVPAGAVGLVGQRISGMGFSTYDGRTTWDKSGVGLSQTNLTARD